MEITGWQPWVVIDKEVFPMVFQGQVLILFLFANLKLHAVKQLMIRSEMVAFHRIKAFFDGILQVFVDVCFRVVTHEIRSGTEVDDRFIVGGNRLCFGIVAHSFHAFHVAVQLTKHDNTIGIGDDLGFFGTGEAYGEGRPFDGLRGLNFYHCHVIHTRDESLTFVA